MAEDRQKALENRAVDYESEDLKLTWIALAAIVILAYLALTPLIVRGGYPSSVRDVDRALATEPPQPQLQTDPQDDLRVFRAREEARLDGYGWVDRSRGVAHIPIEEAMKRLAAQGIDGFPKAAP
jgi:hypothetical protein